MIQWWPPAAVIAVAAALAAVAGAFLATVPATAHGVARGPLAGRPMVNMPG